jgi:hypothetical protein
MTVSAEAAPQPRSRPLAAFLTLLAPGVGHLYIGQRRRALVVVMINFVIGAIGIGVALLLPVAVAPVLLFVLGMLALVLIYWVGAIIDAVRLAGRADAAPPVRWYVLIAAILAFWVANEALDKVTRGLTVQQSWECQGNPLGPNADCHRVR